MFTAFQHSGFQQSGYEIAQLGVNPTVYGGGGTFYSQSQASQIRQSLEKLRRDKAEAERNLSDKETQIEALEEKRSKSLADQALQKELLALFLEAKALEDERQALIALIRRMMMEEDDILVILYSLPFCA